MISEIVGRKGGKSGGGGAARAAQEDPNTLKSIAVARVLDLVSEGEIVGLTNGLRSVYFDGVPVENDDGTFNFEGVIVEQRIGTPVQEYIPGFSSVRAEFSVDTEVLFSVPVSRAVTDPDVDALAVKVVIPALTKQDPENGDLHGHEVSFNIERQASGGSWEEIEAITIKGKTTSDYEQSFRIGRPLGGVPWNVRVTRVSPDSDEDSTIQNKTFWGTYTEITDTKLGYPNCALIGVTINADQFGDKIPKREYDISGQVVSVPTNYDPETREYTGIWDGTFKQAWTDNPAWCYYDMLTNPRYGLGEFVEPSRIDRGRLYQISQFCDELVPDGYGAMEPRFTLNIQIRTRDEAYTLIRKLASSFRGITYWGSGTITPVQDSPTDPEFIASPANVVGGKFTYGSKSLKSLSTAALVTYNDPNDGEKTAIEVYENSEAVAKFGWRQKDISAFGCNSRGLARRTGKWEVEYDQSERRTVQFRVGLDHYRARPFSVIKVQDPLVSGMRLSGRVKSASGNTIVVDALPENINLGYDYTLTFITDDGGVVNADVEIVNVELSSIVLVDTPESLPKSFSMWMLASEQVEPQLFRAKRVSVGNDNVTLTIQAEEYDPNKYLRIEQDLTFDEPDYSDIPTGPIPPPSNLVFNEHLYRDGTALKTALTVSITHASDPRAELVQWMFKRVVDDAWQNLKITSEPFAEILDVRDSAEISVRVRTISRVGRRSTWLDASHIVVGKLAPPAVPTGFVATVDRLRGIILTKDASPDLDYHRSSFYVGESFDESNLISQLAGTQHLVTSASPGLHTFWVRDEDTGFRFSNSVSTSVTITGPLQPLVSFSVEQGNALLSWTDATGSFSIDEYLIRFGSTVIARTKAGGVSIPIDWLGQRIFTVEAVDVVNNVGQPGSIELGINAPVSMLVIYEIQNGRLVLSWDEASSDLPVAFYRVFDSSGLVAELTARTYTVEMNTPGSEVYTVRAYDLAGNEGDPGSVAVDVSPPSRPQLIVSYEGRGIRLAWTSSRTMLPVDFYRIRHEENVLAEVNALTHFIEIDWVGTRTLTVQAFDVAMNVSLPGDVEVAVDAPSQPVLSFAYEHGNVRLSWNNATQSLPIKCYQVFRSGVLIDEVQAQSFLVPVNWQGDEVFGVIPVDSANNFGVEGTLNIAPLAPGAPDVEFSFDGPDVRFVVVKNAGSLPLDKLIIRHDSVVVAEVDSDSWSIPVTWQGQRNFEFLIQDSAKNISPATLITIDPRIPSAPIVEGSFVGRNIIFSWQSTRVDLPIDRYVIRRGEIQIEVTQPTYSMEVDWVGAATISVVSYDSAGNASDIGEYLVAPELPSVPTIESNVIDNTVTFRHLATQGSLPLAAYEIREGAVFDVNDPPLTASGDDNFTTYQDLPAGIYTFHANTRDSAGNRSSPVSFGVLVNQPPDYVFLAEWSARTLGWPGTMMNAYIDGQNRMVLPVNTSESWEQHFTNRGFATPQEQINAGYERYLQPSENTAQYILEYDYGVLITDSLVTVVSSPDELDGNVMQDVILFTSSDGISWSEPIVARQTRAANFRFVRAILNFSAEGGDDLATVDDVIVKLDKKVTTDVGRATINAEDVNGTFISFNLQFLDTFKPRFEFYGTQNVDVIIDHLDQPNPSGFYVYVHDANTGDRLSGEGSWSVDGFAAIPT